MQGAAHDVVQWLVRYGAPVLFVAQMFGIFGVPVPDELLLTIAGVLIRKGQLNAPAVVVAAIGGCLSGISLSYVVGRIVGVAVFQTRLRAHHQSIGRAQRWFRRFGGWLLAFGYFIPGVRHVTAIAAGSAPLDFPTFARYAYPGGVLWCAVFIGLGYYAGDRWQAVADLTRSHLVMASAIVATTLIAYALLRRTAARSSVHP